MTLAQYLEILDCTGRLLRSDKRGAIPTHLAPILERLQINTQTWLETVKGFDQIFGYVVGSAKQIANVAQRIGRRWILGSRSTAQAFI